MSLILVVRRFVVVVVLVVHLSTKDSLLKGYILYD